MIKTLRSLTISALIAATMIPTALAQFASPVKVTNATDTPAPVRDTRQTSSASLTMSQGTSSNFINQAVPTCPNGAEFLITAVSAAPDLLFTASLPTGDWGVAVNLVQKFQGGDISHSLTAFATGAQQASATLPSSQPGFNAGTVDVHVKLLGGPAAGSISFNIHLSGYCGVAFVSPSQQ